VIDARDARIKDVVGHDVAIQRAEFVVVERHPKSLAEALKGRIPDDLLVEVPRGFEVIGDIAILEIPEALEKFEREIGEATLQVNPRFRVVLSKQSAIGTQFRVRELKRIAGNRGTETLHHEHGAVFRLDVSKVYYNSKLSHEHQRVASQVGAGDTVVDMFAGVGPFSILAARNNPSARVCAVELNPDAFAYLKENILLNKVHDKVIPFNADCRKLAERELRAVATRIIMNYPQASKDFIGPACTLLRPEGGILHFYSFRNRRDAADSNERDFREQVRQAGRKVVEIIGRRYVREVGPYRYLHVIDAHVS
jgi:tRNA (guanine37-N1)-methyltransferase